MERTFWQKAHVEQATPRTLSVTLFSSTQSVSPFSIVYSGPIHTIPDSFRITFLTESDIKMSPVHTISDSVFEPVHTAPLRLTWRQKAYCLREVLVATITTGAKIKIENEAAWVQQGFRSDDVSDSCVHTTSKVIRYEKWSDTHRFQSGVISHRKNDTERIGFIRCLVNRRPIWYKK